MLCWVSHTNERFSIAMTTVRSLLQLLEDIDANKLPLFSNLPAPAMAKSYWKLGDDAMFRDLVLAVRCDLPLKVWSELHEAKIYLTKSDKRKKNNKQKTASADDRPLYVHTHARVHVLF